jgi:hypothetical protein
MQYLPMQAQQSASASSAGASTRRQYAETRKEGYDRLRPGRKTTRMEGQFDCYIVMHTNELCTIIMMHLAGQWLIRHRSKNINIIFGLALL